MPDRDTTLTIHGVYNTLYSAVTRPDFKFAVTRYFIDEWVPLLGPSLAWLVVGLRQQCYWNQRRDWCIIDKASLAQDTALNERTIERCLKKSYSDWFVLEITHRYRYRTRIGKKVRDKNRYQLLLDDPLSPRHQLGLAALLGQIAASDQKGDKVETALAALQTLLDMPNLSDKISYTGKIPKDLQFRPILELVEATLGFKLSDYANDPRLVELDRRCTSLYNRIVQPNKIYVGWQYFRMEWVRLLGHALTWFIIYLRRHCFWDETTGELRDTHTTYKKELAAAIGQTTRNLANLVENPYAPLFFSTLETAEAKTSSRNSPTCYRVRMVDEPLTPDDQQRVAAELHQQLQGDSYGRDPETGQLNLFPLFDRLSDRQNFAYGLAPEKTPLSDPKNRRLDAGLPEKMSQHEAASTGKNVATLKDSLRLSDSEEIPEKQRQSAAELKGLKILLDDLLIQEPARSKLLAKPDLTIAEVGAWILYAETQPGLRDVRSYVIRRLLNGDPPPVEFLAFARLDDATWQLFEESVFCLKNGQLLPGEIEPDLIDLFVAWAEIYGDLAPADSRYLLAQASAAPAEDAGPASEPEEGYSQEWEAARLLWSETLDQLQLQMTKQTFNSWLRQTELFDVQDNLFVIDAKSSHAKAWLENRLARSVERTLSDIVGRPTRVEFVAPVGDEGRTGWTE